MSVIPPLATLSALAYIKMSDAPHYPGHPLVLHAPPMVKQSPVASSSDPPAMCFDYGFTWFPVNCVRQTDTPTCKHQPCSSPCFNQPCSSCAIYNHHSNVIFY